MRMTTTRTLWTLWLRTLVGAVALSLAVGSSIMRVPGPRREAPRRLQDRLGVFSVEGLLSSWGRRGPLSGQCDAHAHQLLDAIQRGDLWALKAWDANGKYSSGLFWGNGFWTGSKALCDNLNLNETGDIPFTLGFNTIHIDLAFLGSSAPDNHRILIGLCLPYSCTREDVSHIMELSVMGENNNTMNQDIRIIKVKSPHNTYDMFSDSTFWVLAGITSIMLILMGIGTFYDLYITSSLWQKKSHYLKNNYKYEIRKTVNAKADHLNLKLSAESISSGINLNNNDPNSYDKSITTIVGHGISQDPVSETSSLGQPQGILHRILLSFSVRINLNIICDRSVGADTIPTIHGLRSLSMVWVILGHTCIVAFKYSDNMAYRGMVEKEFLFQTVNNGAFSVDTFFFISGLLVSFLYFRTVDKVDMAQATGTTGILSKFMQYIGMIGYRYCRLTVPYMFVLGVVEICMKWFQYNSVFEPPTQDHLNCPKYWWRNALFINTLFPVQDMCMLWSWYLADDTQFYVLGIIFLILATSHFRLSAATMLVFLVSSWFTTAFIAYTNKHIPSEDDPLALFDKIYDKPWTRLGPYLIGMCVGWLLYKTNCKIKMSKIVVLLGWSISTACFLALVYGLYNVKLDPITGAAYSSLSHTAWALGLGWIVVACSTGYGGFINKVLSSTKLYPFSRVTYCAYLVHPIMIRIMAMTTDGAFHLSKVTVMILFSGQMIASYILSFLVSLTFEAPVVSLLKLFAPPRKVDTH